MAKAKARTATPTAPARTHQATPPVRSARPAAPQTPGRLRVRATQLGYYGEIRRREGDVFTIAGASEFSPTWMERVDPHTPERITTGAQELRKFHDETMRAKAPGGILTDAEEPTGNRDPLNDE